MMTGLNDQLREIVWHRYFTELGVTNWGPYRDWLNNSEDRRSPEEMARDEYPELYFKCYVTCKILGAPVADWPLPKQLENNNDA